MINAGLNESPIPFAVRNTPSLGRCQGAVFDGSWREMASVRRPMNVTLEGVNTVIPDASRNTKYPETLLSLSQPSSLNTEIYTEGMHKPA